MIAPKKILLFVSGSISCYKACTLISLLKKQGHDVIVVASKDALKFVGKVSFEGLTHNKVYTDMFEDSFEIPHIKLSQKWADLIIAYPASADVLNRLASGLCDDLFGAICIANNYKKPLLVAPAMNSNMFAHPKVQESIETLKKWGTIILPCGEGNLACGDNGYGRLLEPEETLSYIQKYLQD